MSDDERQIEMDRVASEWVVRHGGAPLSAAERAALKAWLAADPAHAATFQRMRAVWSEFDALKEDSGSSGGLAKPSGPKRGVPPKTVIAAALLILTALATLISVGDPWIALIADHRTGPGETRTVRLADGTDVDLGAASAIALDFDAQERRIRLLTGEAFFTCAPQTKGETRPFVVEGQGGTTTALGTRFSVEDRGRGITVTAVENRVEVAAGTSSFAVRAVLSPGQAVSYEESKLGPLGAVNTADATAWRRGLLVFDRTPLRDAVARLNRYRRGRIIVARGVLDGRRITGVFRAADLDSAVDIIAAELSARTVTLPFLTVLY